MRVARTVGRRMPITMNSYSKLFRRLQAGLSMIEVLVSLTIVAFGVLGLLGLQARALSFQRDSFDRRTAAEMVAQLAERMRANHLGLTGGLYAPPTAPTLTPPTPRPQRSRRVQPRPPARIDELARSRLGAVDCGIPATQSRCRCLPAVGSGRSALDHGVGRVAGAAADAVAPTRHATRSTSRLGVAIPANYRCFETAVFP